MFITINTAVFALYFVGIYITYSDERLQEIASHKKWQRPQRKIVYIWFNVFDVWLSITNHFMGNDF